MRMAGGLILKDIARDGRTLVIRDIERSEIVGRIAGADKEERNLSWLDVSVVADVSDDGSTLLFMEQGVAAGSTYAVCLRGTDGSPVLRLGEGAASGLSPDTSCVLSILYGTPSRLVLLPTGAGDPAPLPPHDIVDYSAARWVPDGRRIVFIGKRGDGTSGCFIQPLDGGAPELVTADPVLFRGLPVSPDSQSIVCTMPDGKLMRYPLVGGGEPTPVPGVAANDVLVRWADDGQSLFVYRHGELPTVIQRVNVATGARSIAMKLMPSDPAGVANIGQIRLTPDGQSCVYSFKRILSELYLVEGLV